ncbi:hypothetical protein [Candidatus Leptofilum sp.]|uniref:hypothetical protein n=1 Tax=Candidatus Leptofilum sp. TaxID=3241576 RepID=UPI003B5A2FD5
MYQLRSEEQVRLLEGIRAAYAIPFIDDITSFIWEAIFSYVKDVPIVDPLKNTRSKLLYDVVDQNNHIGWSAKALQKTKSLAAPIEFELVIQRADIFKKAQMLGFDQLSVNSPSSLLGQALTRHWHLKINEDAVTQNINSKRVCVLIKSNNRKEYIYYENDIEIYGHTELTWSWTDSSKTGLQGIRNSDGFVVYRWYPNQKQFFERFQVSSQASVFYLEPRRLPLANVVQFLAHQLDNS